MKPAPFDYVRATSLDHAIDSLARFGDEAKVLAGGQSLVPMMALRLARPKALVDLGDLSNLSFVKDGGELVIGGTTTHTVIARDRLIASIWPMVREGTRQIGHEAIRNRGTIGGSLAHADPAAEWPLLALTLGAEIDVVGSDGPRTIPAADLFDTYFTTSLRPDEIITEVRVPIPSAEVGSAFRKLARRPGDFGIVGVAVIIHRRGDDVAEARIGLGGIADTPVRVLEAEAVMRDERFSPELVAAAADEAARSIEPHEDVHASSDYRRDLSRVLTARAVTGAWSRAGRHDA